MSAKKKYNVDFILTARVCGTIEAESTLDAVLAIKAQIPDVSYSDLGDSDCISWQASEIDVYEDIENKTEQTHETK